MGLYDNALEILRRQQPEDHPQHQRGHFARHASPGGRASSGARAVAASASSTAAKEERIQISDGSEDGTAICSGSSVYNVAAALDFDGSGDVGLDGRSNRHTGAVHTAASLAVSTDMRVESDASSGAVAYNPFASAFATIQPFWLGET